jgi:hypothetical protein
MSSDQGPAPGSNVVLVHAPDALLSGLTEEDQSAIREVVRKLVILEEYDEDGRAVLKFTDANNVIHFVFVAPELIRRSG